MCFARVEEKIFSASSIPLIMSPFSTPESIKYANLISLACGYDQLIYRKAILREVLSPLSCRFFAPVNIDSLASISSIYGMMNLRQPESYMVLCQTFHCSNSVTDSDTNGISLSYPEDMQLRGGISSQMHFLFLPLLLYHHVVLASALPRTCTETVFPFISSDYYYKDSSPTATAISTSSFTSSHLLESRASKLAGPLPSRQLASATFYSSTCTGSCFNATYQLVFSKQDVNSAPVSCRHCSFSDFQERRYRSRADQSWGARRSKGSTCCREHYVVGIGIDYYIPSYLKGSLYCSKAG